MTQCLCGCGQTVKPGNKYVNKHQSRGRKASEETRRKMSESRIGAKNPMYGKHLSEEAKRKLSEGRKGEKHWGYGKRPWNYGKHITDETRQKISNSLKGRKFTPEHSRRKSEAQMGEKNPMFGKKPWNLGIPHTETTKKKIGDANRGKLAREKHHNWLGGITHNPYGAEFNNLLKMKVRERDGYVCQFPRCHRKRTLFIHHVDFDKTNNTMENLVTLCLNHNAKVNYDRPYWTEYFQNIKKGGK